MTGAARTTGRPSGHSFYQDAKRFDFSFPEDSSPRRRDLVEDLAKTTVLLGYGVPSTARRISCPRRVGQVRLLAKIPENRSHVRPLHVHDPGFKGQAALEARPRNSSEATELMLVVTRVPYDSSSWGYFRERVRNPFRGRTGARASLCPSSK